MTRRFLTAACALAALALLPAPGGARGKKNDKPADKPSADKKQTPQQAAQDAANAWLALVDAGKYGESWDAAATEAKLDTGKSAWVDSLKSSRDPAGRLQSRVLQFANPTDRIPGAAKGDYVIFVYSTAFENAPEATEKVVPMRDKDGVWRVSGYSISRGPKPGS